ncbi:MAG TPA: hypothetical protein VKT81_17210 [Bryobacteraceae bacterium]|nr:hypothetical protein [Bryobacteraceae bacterium]
MQRSIRISAVLLTALVASAQPFINYRGVVNGASFTPPGLSGSQIARGSVFSIFGQGLGPATLTKVSGFPLLTTLAGVSVQVIQGNTIVNAFPIVVTANQVNAIMPSDAPLGRVAIQVTYNSTPSNTTAATVAANSFGIFAANSGGFGPGILYNFVAQNNQPLNSLVETAAPGQVITLWGTGLGPVSVDNVAPAPGNLATPVEIFVGGVLASKQYSGRSPCCAGVDQIVFTVPASAPLGCYVPVQIRTAGTTLSNAVTMAIQKGGAPCSDPGNAIAPLFAKGGKVGAAILFRSMLRTDVDTSQPTDISTDAAMISFDSAPGGPLFFNSALSAPPPGSCTMYSVSGRRLILNIPAFASGLGNELDAGPTITITGTSQFSLSRALSPLYTGYLGTNDPNFGASTLVFNTTGTTQISALGGADVGLFQVAVPPAVQVNWLNRLQIETIDRTRPLTVTWSPAGLQDSTMVIAGSNYDLLTNTTGTFLCTTSAAAGSFAVPSYILGALLASSNNFGGSYGVLALAAIPSLGLTTFKASGLDTGVAVQIFASAKTVLFR